MQFDCVIHGGSVIDGTGRRAPFPADVGVIGDRIAAVGNLGTDNAGLVIDAHGRAVSPGFIDVHVHSEMTLLGGRDQMAGIRQGITTQLLAPDGFGWAPLPPEKAREMWHYTQFAYGPPKFPINWPTIESYLSLFPGRSPANVYPQVPHCAVRLGVMGWDPRPPTDDELKAMENTTRAWMEAGAGVLCLGLDYQPSANTTFRELVALSKVAASYGGIYAAHIRYQILGREKAWEETMELARQSGIPVHISHERVDGITAPLLDRVDREGIDLTFESYLYPAGMTHIIMQLPMSVQIGSPEEVLEKMKDPQTRATSLPYLRRQLGTVGNQIVGYTNSSRFTGMTLAEAARSVNKPWEEFVYDLVLEEDGIEAFIVPWQTPAEENAETLNRTAVHPRMMIASDGVYDVPHPHPRSYGCFVQFLGRFVRERKLISLEEAVYKMSGFPAQRFGLKDRGRIAEELPADLVVFDPATVADRSTWQDPIQTAVGVEWVLVNGEVVIEQGTPTGRLPGRVLRRGA
ncbi:MAG: D-aminoacylase [Candidatus Tectomicrobia bacterium]|nr:D-aminoacylase [Candidatus Tectomicrobia bacterium]